MELPSLPETFLPALSVDLVQVVFTIMVPHSIIFLTKKLIFTAKWGNTQSARIPFSWCVSVHPEGTALAGVEWHRWTLAMIQLTETTYRTGVLKYFVIYVLLYLPYFTKYNAFKLILLYKSEFHSFWRPNNTPLYVHITFCSFLHLLMANCYSVFWLCEEYC